MVKPLDGNHGRGVALNLRSEDEVRAAFQVAQKQTRSGDVVVETFITGNDYRVLVIGGKLAAVAERVPAHVIGDGEHTVRQLVDADERGPAARHRPREGADADPARRERRRRARRARASPPTASPRPARS